MTCPTVTKLGTLAIEKLDVLNAINAHLIDVFQGAAFCRYLKPDLIMVIQKKDIPPQTGNPIDETKIVLGALAENWKPGITFCLDFTVPRQG